MTSIQERLQLKRIALDKWTIREQLCLASAVSCSGDQNWMSVSRSLKVLCGANRPADWFSQKSCAVQYGELLENVETPKRKKRTASERDNQPTTETPTESILRKLTQERIAELKQTIQAEQEEYAKLREEILAVQNGTMDDEQIRDMWRDIEKEMEQKLIEKQKYEQWLKEREERKNELQRASRTGLFHTKQLQLNLPIKTEDVEIEESIAKPGTSPLLTSLLKSPATTPTSSSSPTNVRVTAPTITNLLTGGNSTTSQAPLLGPAQNLQHLQNQPLTGPPATIESTQNVTPKPSQAAPTLSMLLENKSITHKPIIANTEQMVEVKIEEPEPMEIEDGSCSSNKDEELMEVFKGLMPDNIDELEEILTNNNAIIPELLEEESILENVDSLIGEQEETDNKTKIEDDAMKTESEIPKNLPASSPDTEIKDEIQKEVDGAEDVKDEIKMEGNSGGGQPTNEPDKSLKEVADDKSDAGSKKTTATDSDVDNQDSSNSSDVQVIEPMEEVVQESEKPVSRQSSPIKSLPSKPAEETVNREKMETESTPSIQTDEMTKKEDPSKPINELDEAQVPETAHTTETISETASDNTTTITIIDTDDDSTIEVIKEDKIGKMKRDYSRRKTEIIEKKLDDIDENRLSLSLRKLRDRDGSESPLVDDETYDSMPRTRRRYSSTPVIDSIPNSPASSDDRDYRTWKKCVLTVYNRISTHKYASIFSKQAQDETATSYKQLILRPMDIQTIKQNIESGATRTTTEFQRDVMLMCQNAIMFYAPRSSSAHVMAKEFMTEMAMTIEALVETARKDAELARSLTTGTSSIKNRGRKSTRLP